MHFLTTHLTMWLCLCALSSDTKWGAQSFNSARGSGSKTLHGLDGNIFVHGLRIANMKSTSESTIFSCDFGFRTTCTLVQRKRVVSSFFFFFFWGGGLNRNERSGTHSVIMNIDVKLKWSWNFHCTSFIIKFFSYGQHRSIYLPYLINVSYLTCSICVKEDGVGLWGIYLYPIPKIKERMSAMDGYHTDICLDSALVLTVINSKIYS